MQRARRSFSIEIWDVAIGDHAELREVQMRVQTLKRIKRPRDFVESLLERALTLSEFQVEARVTVSIVRFDREHV